jgi:hypothetical protein
MAFASPARSGDYLAGVGAATAQQRMAARHVLADTPLKQFLTEALVPYESDNITRLIIDGHDAAAFAPVSHLTVGDFRNWLLSDEATTATLTALAPGLTPEMVAAVSKLMRNQDLVSVAKKCSVVTRFRDTIGLPGHLSVRLQPNHPTDDLRGVAASTLDGLLYGAGDAVIGLNPASDSMPVLGQLLRMLDEVIQRFEIPTQSCVLTHVTNTLKLAEAGAPVDLVFQSIAGTEKANLSFGVTPELLDEAYAAALSLKRGTVGDNVMYFETGQGSALSANANFGVDQQTCEVRAYALARRYKPLSHQHGGRLHRARVPVRRQADHPRGPRRSLQRQAAGPAHRLRHLLHQPCRGRPGRHGHAARAAGHRGHQLHHGHSGRGRRDAQLPEHLVPRRAVPARDAGPEARARVRGVAAAHADHRRGGTARAAFFQPAAGRHERAGNALAAR